MPRTYVDNAYNRRLGRVGMPLGTMVVSRSSSGVEYITSRSYVDNAKNRALGRVGLPRGSMPESWYSDSPAWVTCKTPSATKTYVDDVFEHLLDSRSSRSQREDKVISGSSPDNGERTPKQKGVRAHVGRECERHLGREDELYEKRTVYSSQSDNYSNKTKEGRTGDDYIRHTGRVSRLQVSEEASKESKSKPICELTENKIRNDRSHTRQYKDNAMNRKLGRVGLPLGTAVYSKSDDSGHSKVYVDNAQNRALGRVGLPVRSRTNLIDSSKPTKVYVDNVFNRAVGRVGLPLGSAPVSRCSKKMEMTRRVHRDLLRQPEKEVDMDHWQDRGVGPQQQDEACNVALDLINRDNQVRRWQQEAKFSQQLSTDRSLIQSHRDTRILCSDLKLQNRIGSGRLGEVYFAKWKGTVVTVKKLKIQRVSKQRIKRFTDEMFLFCHLDHPNVICYIGVCTSAPELFVVMEYMQGSLFEALHIRDDTDLTEEDRSSIITQTASGMAYLHENKIAHCNMKSSNVLLCVKDCQIIAKITDLQLNVMLEEMGSSVSPDDFSKNIGTWQYTAPEVLRGEILDARAKMRADMYSLGLVVYETVCEEEPFPYLNYRQLRKNVGERELIPEIPHYIQLNKELFQQLMACWSRRPKCRPTASELWSFLDANCQLYKHFKEE